LPRDQFFHGIHSTHTNQDRTMKSTRTLIKNARVFDSIDGRVGEPTTISVVDGKVESVGASVALESDAFDLGGRVVLPGLIDCHVHGPGEARA
jgi:imidazolonepropionase-like amidohydrolase